MNDGGVECHQCDTYTEMKRENETRNGEKERFCQIEGKRTLRMQ